MTKENFRPEEEKNEQQMSTRDYEKFGRHLLSIDPKMARSYLELSSLPHEEIEALISFSEKSRSESEKEKKIMDSEDYKKMAEDHEKKFEKTGKTEHYDLARAYRREAEKMEKKEI